MAGKMAGDYPAPSPNQFVHETTFPVRYGETDQMGVVHHSVAAIWLEEGRTRMMEDAGYPYSIVEQEGLFLPMVELRIRYRKPARYGSSVTVQTWIRRATRAKIVFGNRVVNPEGDILIEATAILGCISRESGRPVGFNARLQRFLDTDGRDARLAASRES